MSDIYLSLTETPAVVSLSNPVIAGGLADSVTVTNVVSVNVVTMPAITVQAAAPAVTTVSGTVTANACGDYEGIPVGIPIWAVGDYQNDTLGVKAIILDGNGANAFLSGGVTIGSLPAISGTVTASVQNLGLPFVKISASLLYDGTVVDVANPLIINQYAKKINDNLYRLDRGNYWIELIAGGGTGWETNAFFDPYNWNGIPNSGYINLALYDIGDQTTVPPSGSWFVQEYNGFTGTFSVSHEQPSIQPISGTVTATLSTDAFNNTQGGIAGDEGGSEPTYGVQLGYFDGDYKTVKPSNPLPIFGTVTASPAAASSASVTVFSETSSAEIAAANGARKVITIFNSSANPLYVLLGTGTASSSNFSFALGENEVLSLSNITCAVQGVIPAGGDAYVTELE